MDMGRSSKIPKNRKNSENRVLKDRPVKALTQSLMVEVQFLNTVEAILGKYIT